MYARLLLAENMKKVSHNDRSWIEKRVCAIVRLRPCLVVSFYYTWSEARHFRALQSTALLLTRPFLETMLAGMQRRTLCFMGERLL